LIDLDEYREAEVWLNKALGLYPKNPGLLSARAWSLALSGRTSEGLAASDEALAGKAADLPFGWLDRGAVLLSQGSEDTARSNFEKALEEHPDDWFFLMRVGMLYQRHGRSALALDFYLKASGLAPAVPFLCYRLGQAWQALGNQARAKAAFERALEISPHYRPAFEALVALNNRSGGGIFRTIADFFTRKK